MFNSKFSRDVSVHKQLFIEIDMQFANQFNTSTSCMQVIKLKFCVQGPCVWPLNDVLLALPSHRYTTLYKLKPDCCGRTFQIHKWLHSAVVQSTKHKHTHTYVHVHMRVHVHAYAYTHFSMCNWTNACADGIDIRESTSTCVYMNTCVHKNKHVYIRAHITYM